MKKILCGAMLVLAAVAGFSSCKKENNSKTEETTPTPVTSLNLNHTSVTMYVGENTLLTAKTNTGAKKPLTWKSSNPLVATVSSIGQVTAVGEGEATVTVMLAENTSIKAACKITVTEDKLSSLTFTQASVTFPDKIDSTVVETVEGRDAQGKKVADLYAYRANATLVLYSDGFYINKLGVIVSENKDKAYAMMLKTQVYVIPANLNPDQFEKESDFVVWVAGSRVKYETSEEEGYYKFKPGKVNEEAYVAEMKEALSIYNNVKTGAEGTTGDYVRARYAAVEKSMEGALLYQYLYTQGTYAQDFTPVAIVQNLTMQLDYGGNSDYMYKVASYDMTVKPVGGYQHWGVDVTELPNGTYKFNSDNFVWEDREIHYGN